ncbi:hypothetical protein N0V83_009924 [Neocucurbitaria cava]|uniref:Uncharacterized protein n=1 Tax=Neocucurbitaria cava TaxID=798079 RepID=A0A9W9CI73_9PLEO|nr:hypothetical protein N0V83_009924 [Neocucurbitaria cava]
MKLANFTETLTRAPNESVYTFNHTAPIPFECLAPTWDAEKYNGPTDQWRISICQLGEAGGRSSVAGGLVSEFRDSASVPTADTAPEQRGNPGNFGNAYLVLNVSLGSEEQWQAVTENGATPPLFSVRGEWLDLLYSDARQALSVTLCYTAFDSADIPVKISGDKNRTEPLPTYLLKENRYYFDAVRQQLGQHRDTQTLADRNILSLVRQRESWLAQDDEIPPLEPFLRSASDIDNIGDAILSAILWESKECVAVGNSDVDLGICPELMHVWLFQEIVRTGGSIAFALQSLITVLAGLAYYDQLAQFDKIDDSVAITRFITTNVPQRIGGFVAVTVVMVVYMLLVTVVLWLFLTQSRFSLLGNTWQCISQVVTEHTTDYVDAGSTLTDTQMGKVMQGRGEARNRVGLWKVGGTGNIGLKEL